MFKITFCITILLYLWDLFVVFGCNKTDITLDQSNHKCNSSDADRCGGWGKKISSMEQYERIKDKCYLTIRKKRLCCIDFPYCPDGMVAEIPLKPYFMYPIHELKIGCRPQEKDDEETGSPKKPKIDIVVCYADGKKKKKKIDFLCEMGVSDCFNLVIYCTFAYLLVLEIKKETAWPELKIRLKTYIQLLLIYHLLVLLLRHACYMLFYLLVVLYIEYY